METATNAVIATKCRIKYFMIAPLGQLAQCPSGRAQQVGYRDGE
jgi:hypothetical protein